MREVVALKFLNYVGANIECIDDLYDVANDSIYFRPDAAVPKHNRL